MPPKILIVDDMPHQAEMLCELMRIRGFETMESHCYEEAVSILDAQHVDLAMVDYVLPGRGGVLLARHIASQHPQVGILMISAFPDVDLTRGAVGVAHKFVHKGDGIEAIHQAVLDILGLDAAADPRLPQRFQSMPGPPASSEPAPGSFATPSWLVVGDLHLSFSRQQAWLGTTMLQLTPAEFRVLTHLAENAGLPVDVSALIDLFAATPRGRPSPSRIAGIIHALRKKMEPDLQHPRYLITVRGSGYQLVVEGPRSAK